jgi:hypothetical protein
MGFAQNSAEKMAQRSAPPPPPQAPEQSRAQVIGERLGQAVAIVVVIVLPILMVIVAVRTYKAGEISTKINPINEILASRIVVGGIRIAILFAIAYVIVSMIALTIRRQWLTGIGPLRVSEAARGVEAERDYLAQQLTFAGQEIESLQVQLGAR